MNDKAMMQTMPPFLRQRSRVMRLFALICVLSVALAPGIAKCAIQRRGRSGQSDGYAGRGRGLGLSEWEAPADAEYHFVAWLPVGASPGDAQIKPVGAGGQAAISGLTPDKAYYFTVIAGRWEWSPDDFGAKWSAWSSWAIAVPSSGSPDTDRAALVALYNATNGANWNNNERWLSNLPLAHWHGVVTDGNGRVTALYLGNNQLNGVMPAELGDLYKLQTLHLYYNQLRYKIPAELGRLSNLRDLNLDGNGLTGEIPAELGNLTNLENLNLERNRLSGGVPAELGQPRQPAQIAPPQ